MHECTEEACTEDENSLQSLSEPNDLTNTKYGVLDDFFDKVGGSTKTQDKEAALMAHEKNEETFDTKKWLGDSGASLHVGKDDKYMMAVKPTQEKVTIGDSTTVTMEGRSKACLTTSEGQYLQLEDCLYIPDFDRNIISLGRFASKGHRIEMTKPGSRCGASTERTR